MMIGKLIRAYRETQKLSVRQMAKIIGVDHSALWNFERGGRIRTDNWVKIAKWVLTEEA